LVWTKYHAGGKLPVSDVHFRTSFWGRDILKLLTQFKGIAVVCIQDGQTSLLWHDLWNGLMCNKMFPELLSFAKNQYITVAEAASSPFLHDLFHLPLSPEAYGQYLILSDTLQNLQLNDTFDQWSYLWGSSLFSSSRAYRSLIGHRQVHRVFKWLWKSSCQNKRKFFFWLILQDRLNTRAMLQRCHMHLPDYSCVLCNLNVQEDVAHLLFQCPFSLNCWATLHFQVPNSLNIEVIIESFGDQIRVPFFLEIFITMCWSIWSMRNDIIFRNIPHSVHRCKQV
jgi:hypothetical protein